MAYGGEYTAYFKEDPTTGQVIKYIKDNIEITYQPMALNFNNQLSQLQQIEMINSVEGIPGIKVLLHLRRIMTNGVN